MRTEKWKELKNYIEELKTIKVEEDSSSPSFLSISSAYYTLNNGEVIKRDKLEKNHSSGNAVIILPITIEGECLLAIEPRVFTDKTVGIGFPAGYVEKDEDYLVAASRELLEETGFQARCLKTLASFYQDEGCSEAYNYGVLAMGCEKVASQSLDSGEFVRYFTCTLDEVDELVQKRYIQGANSQLLLEKAKTYLKK